MAKLLLFNPSNDMALAANVRRYLPPRRVQQMEADLAEFPRVWAEEDDAILCTSSVFIGVASQDCAAKPNCYELVPLPMGWSLATKTRFAQAGIVDAHLPSEEQLALWRTLSSRRFATSYIHQLILLSDESISRCFVGEKMHFYEQLDDVLFPAVFKSPWSSSGRGVFVAKQYDEATRKRLEGYLSSQGGFLSDSFYADKKLDFAFEYELKSDGTVAFVGYSVFEAGIDGNYGGNYVASQDDLRRMILSALVPDIPVSVLDELRDLHSHLLRQTLGDKYTGYVGIDMMVVKDAGRVKIHPCVEINLRMNMGIIAIRLFEKLERFQRLEQETQRLRFRDFFFPFAALDDLNNCMRSSTRLPLTPNREHGFQALMESCKLIITFS